MFGFQSGKPVEQNFDSESNLDGIEFSDADLNDPDLLAELAAMTLESQPKVTMQKEVKLETRVEPVDVDNILASIPVVEVEEDVHVVFTDEDMDDPHLLAELHAVSGEQPVRDEQSVEHSHTGPLNQGARENIHTNIGEIQHPEEELSLEYKLKSTNIPVLTQYVQLEKIKALNKKRAGDKAGALENLKAAKELEKRIQDLESIKESALTNPVPSSPIKGAVETKLPPAKVKEVVPTIPAEEEHLDLVDTVELEERSLEYKRAALAYKKLNQLEKAREMLAISKSIQSAIANSLVDFKLPSPPEFPNSATLPVTEDLKSPKSLQAISPQVQDIPANSPPKVNEDPSDPSVQLTEAINSQVTQSTSSAPTVGSCDELINHLEATLESQIQLCTRLSAQYFTASEKEKALEFHKRKKTLIQDKETLLAFKKIPLNPASLPFTFSYTTLEYMIAQTHTDVALDELELNIIKGVDLVVKDVSELETGVTFDFGWPFSSAGTNPEGKGETAIKKGTSPGELPLTVDYVFKKIIKIERSKGFQRFLERKKAAFEVFYLSKSLFGMLAKRVTLGKITLKLDDLLSKREIHDILPIMDISNPRKATGGKIEIKIRMRAPLIKADVVKNADKWLVLSFGQANTVQANETPQKAETVSVDKPKKDSKEFEPQGKANPQLAETKSATTISSSSASLNQDAENEEYILNFLNPDLIASNQVLEHEHGNIIKRIAESKTPQEDLLDLKNSYEIKMNMLVTSIQLGALDMPMYLKQVKEAIALSKQQALHFKKIGRMDLAGQAMVRFKLMTAEVKEVEDSQ
ncbi:Coiled-coil and C2 domain-containing protein 1B [Boothiomyces sp. JEL0866]|nr:Coiled-coil and C2 domain-containing protein 1B [Boothiomyces sp. JEL0866]